MRETTYAARSKVFVVLNPSVWVSLNQIGSLYCAIKGWRSTHVGKYWTKLRPNSCDVVMIANKDTRGSLMAIMSPWTCLMFESSSSNSTTIKVAYDLRFFCVVFVCFSNILGETDLCESTLDCAHPSCIVGLKRGIKQKWYLYKKKKADIIW